MAAADRSMIDGHFRSFIVLPFGRLSHFSKFALVFKNRPSGWRHGNGWRVVPVKLVFT
jgi:hypothetical protein